MKLLLTLTKCQDCQKFIYFFLTHQYKHVLPHNPQLLKHMSSITRFLLKYVTVCMISVSQIVVETKYRQSSQLILIMVPAPIGRSDNV